MAKCCFLGFGTTRISEATTVRNFKLAILTRKICLDMLDIRLLSLNFKGQLISE